MSGPTILSSAPRVRYDDDFDDELPPPAQMLHLTQDPVSKDYTASAMGITVRHARRDVAIAECERQLAASPASWEQTVDRQFRPIR